MKVYYNIPSRSGCEVIIKHNVECNDIKLNELYRNDDLTSSNGFAVSLRSMCLRR